MNCPYPACSLMLGDPHPRLCACDKKDAIRVCFQCGMACPGNARYCRACQAAFPAETFNLSRRSQLVGPDWLIVPGTFCMPPVMYGGFLWALTVDGVLYRLSPKAGAKPVQWCRIPSEKAGLQRFSIVNIPVGGDGPRGPVALAIDANGIHAVSLVQPGVRWLIRHPQPGEIVVNSRIEESPYFRGVSAGTSFCSFLFQCADSSGTRLVIRYFDPDRAAEEPVTLEGRLVLGPTVSEDAVGVCGEDEVHIFCTGDRSKHSFLLPAGFVPYFQRPARGVNVPAAQMPFAVKKGREGWCAWIGGEYQQQPTLLAVQLDQGHHQTYSLQEGSCICAIEGSGVVVNQVSHADFWGMPKPRGRFASLKAGMPVAWDGTVFCCFQQTDSPSKLEIACWAAGADPQILVFEDSSCNENSCFGVHRLGNNLLVSYQQLPPASSAIRGLKFASWSIL